jgi:hypothetical protein
VIVVLAVAVVLAIYFAVAYVVMDAAYLDERGNRLVAEAVVRAQAAELAIIREVTR